MLEIYDIMGIKHNHGECSSIDPAQCCNVGRCAVVRHAVGCAQCAVGQRALGEVLWAMHSGRHAVSCMATRNCEVAFSDTIRTCKRIAKLPLSHHTLHTYNHIHKHMQLSSGMSSAPEIETG